MSYSNYVNIDGDIDQVTPWYLEPYEQYGDDISYRSEYHKGYTTVEKEIPTVSGAVMSDSEYWESAPYLQSKLSTHNVFCTSVDHYSGSLEAFINGIKVDDAHVTDLGDASFSISPDAGNGFLYVSYVPTPDNCMGDNSSALSSSKVESEYHGGTVRIADIVRCRQAINALQIYSEYPLTNWIGGVGNNIKSRATNIVKGRTGIYSEHIIEMQNALTELADHLDGLSTTDITSATFTDVVESDNYSVQWIEEIRADINRLELYLIGIL